MTYRTKPEARWREFLTTVEESQVRGIEFNTENLRKDLAKQVALLGPIRNRALKRMVRAGKDEAK